MKISTSKTKIMTLFPLKNDYRTVRVNAFKYLKTESHVLMKYILIKKLLRT